MKMCFIVANGCINKYTDRDYANITMYIHVNITTSHSGLSFVVNYCLATTNSKSVLHLSVMAS